MISTIFFDVGGTLIHPNLSTLMAPLLARAQPTAAQLAAADRAAKYSYHRNGDDTPAGNKGHWQVYFETLLASLGCCGELLPELNARAGDSSHWTELDPAAPATLARLRPRYRLAVISNADGRIHTVLERAGIARHFEQVIDSGLIGHEKPDPRIFRAALDRMQVPAAESLYVGDIYAVDYQGATAAGMRAVLIDPNAVYRDWDAPRLDSLADLPAWLEGQR